MKNFAALTICSINYIPKALVLIDTYRLHHPEHAIYLVIVDKKTSQDLGQLNKKLNLHVIWVEDLEIDDFLSYAFMYDVIELNTNVKPFALKRILSQHQAVVYLDPDIKIYAPLTPVFEALITSSIVVTPHCSTPVCDGFSPDDIDLLKFGAFNLGFIGLSNCDEAISFLNWWSERCLNHGFYEPQLGLAVDQKWINLAPCFFPNLKILHNTGLNLAFWNLHERFISFVDGNWIVNGGEQLRFIHFSSFNPNFPDVIAYKQNRFLPGSRQDFIELATTYAKELNANENDSLSSVPYGFDYFDNGTYITPALRRFYAALKNSKFKSISNPFDSLGLVLKFAQSNSLLLKSNQPSKRKTFQDMGSYGLQIKLIDKAFRFALFLLGPDRYFNLMRYLAHISSLRNQAKIFEKNKIK